MRYGVRHFHRRLGGPFATHNGGTRQGPDSRIVASELSPTPPNTNHSLQPSFPLRPPPMRTDDSFDQHINTTIGVGTSSRSPKIDNLALLTPPPSHPLTPLRTAASTDFKVKMMNVRGKRVKMTIWDTAGQVARFMSGIRNKSSFHNAHAHIQRTHACISSLTHPNPNQTSRKGFGL